jgi:hypothetical protein
MASLRVAKPEAMFHGLAICPCSVFAIPSVLSAVGKEPHTWKAMVLKLVELLAATSEATSTSADHDTRPRRGEREHKKTNRWTPVCLALWVVAQLRCSNGHLHKNEEHVGSSDPSAQRLPIVISPRFTLPNSPF